MWVCAGDAASMVPKPKHLGFLIKGITAESKSVPCQLIKSGNSTLCPCTSIGEKK